MCQFMCQIQLASLPIYPKLPKQFTNFTTTLERRTEPKVVEGQHPSPFPLFRSMALAPSRPIVRPTDGLTDLGLSVSRKLVAVSGAKTLGKQLRPSSHPSLPRLPPTCTRWPCLQRGMARGP